MKGVRQILLAAATAVMLSVGACDWPDSGTGGLAERDRPATPAMEQAAATIDRLRQAGGDKYAPADLAEAQILLTRAERQYAGGLKAAADADLVRVNATLERAEQRIASGPSQNAGRSRPANGAPNALLP